MQDLLTVLGIVAIGAIVAGVIQSFASMWIARHQHAAERVERAAARAHELELRRWEDDQRLREARMARLREDGRELTMALFDLQRVMLLLQWGRDHAKSERESLEETAWRRYERARAGLAMDPDGQKLAQAFMGLSDGIARYESMLESQRALVEARVGQEAIDHAAKIEEQRKLVLDGIDDTIKRVGDLLSEIGRPQPAIDLIDRTGTRALPP
ncbi:MAG TPA: hypothetical protein VKK19_04950 [Candidatus Dormibacteraeota bacterium]|nr:hypothetical protein [Candidatus Dormibacteraeota bacterium]